MTRSPRSTILLTLAGFLCLGALPALRAQDSLPTDRVMRLVRILLEQEHISERPLDDAISRRAMDAFFDNLDPLKLYFEKSDIRAFRKLDNELDDFTRRGDLRFAKLVFKTYLKRLDQRVELVKELLTKKLDFTKEEFFVTDGDVAIYGDGEQVKDRWRRRVKYDLLRLRADEVKEEDQVDRVRRRYTNFRRRMNQMDDEEILSYFLGAIASAYDPHTTYIAPKPYEDFLIGMRLNYQGVGAHLQDQDGIIVVTKIIPGGAIATYEKIKEGDQILGVGQGTDGEIVDVVGDKISDVVKLIRGKEGTVVRLQIRPKGGGETKIHQLARARIQIAEDRAQSATFEMDGTKIGVIDLPSFYKDGDAQRRRVKDYRSCTRDTRALLEQFKKDGVDCVVLDLRWNGGGLLDEAIKLTGLFIDQGPVVQVKDGRGRITGHDDPEPGMVWEGPLVVLTSRLSASASEIVAGAVQDYRRGIVVGDLSTHGKGSVQQVLELGRLITERGKKAPNLGALKITMQKFYRPDGDSTQLHGIRSDLVIPSLVGEAEGESSLDHALEFDHVPPAPHASHGLVTDKIRQELNGNSKKRQKDSQAFQRTHRDILRYRKLRKMKQIPLEQEAFETLQKDQEEGPEVAEPEREPGQRIRKDDYLDEVLRIAAEYAKMIAERV